MDRFGGYGHGFEEGILPVRLLEKMGGVFVCPGGMDQVFPSGVAIPMLWFLITPPNPPIAWPLKWARLTR